MKKTNLALLALVTGIALLSGGCATKKYVAEQTGAVHTRVDGVEKQVEENQQAIRKTDSRVTETQERVGKNEQATAAASKTAQEALVRAQEAGKLAEGKFLYESVLTDDKVRFGFNASELSPEAKAALDEFAAKLAADNKSVYLEIQGHTDSVGRDQYNEELGLERAEAVRNYLNRTHKFPLHRMNCISYGESEPISDNSTREGRGQNRRVVLVVLQ